MSFEYNGVVYRDLEPQVRYDAEQVQLLKQADVTINENLQTVNENLQTVNTEIDGKLTKPANPSAESAVTMLADGTVGTKPLSEIGGGGGGKLYMHNLSILVKTGETLNGTIIGSIISTNNAPITEFTNTMLKQTMIDVTIYKGSTTGSNNIYLTDRKVSDLSSISTAGNISVYAYSAGASTYPFSNNLEEIFSGTSQTVYDTVTEL